MRLSSPLAALALSALALPATAGERETVHHEIEVRIEPAEHKLVAYDTIMLPEAWRGTDPVTFVLDSALRVSSARGDCVVTEWDPTAAKDDAHGAGDPPPPVPAGWRRWQVRPASGTGPVPAVFRVRYEGAIHHPPVSEGEEYARSFARTRGTIQEDGVVLSGATAWLPRFGDELITFTLEVNLPEGWDAVSQGTRTKHEMVTNGGTAVRRVVRWESPEPMDEAYVIAARFTEYARQAGDVTAQAFLRTPDPNLAAKYLEATAQYLEMYRQLIGPYPFTKFALIENFWETGYGMPSFTLLGPKVIRFPFILHSSYPHEILHNWWGNSVFVDHESGNWCEGLTAYMADHLVQEQRGKGQDYRRNTLQKYRDYAKEGRDFPLREFRSRHSAATEAVGYGKALMMFHMLRRQLGDEAFRGGLITFYRKNRGRRASFDDLREAFEAVADEELGTFFQQWVERTGSARLVLSGVEVRDEGGTLSVLGELEQAQSGAPYALEIPVRVQTAEGATTFMVKSAARRERFELELPARPLELSVDPLFDLFRELDPRETPASIGQIFGDPEVLAVLPAASSGGADVRRYRRLVDGWASPEHEVTFVLDTELDSLPSDRAVWVLGFENRFNGGFADRHMGLSSVEPGLRLEEQELPLRDHCFVIVRPNPENAEQAVGWIVLGPDEATEGLARKLPHYGKYSFLAFEGVEPTNVVKGQWETSESPLVVRWDGGAGSPAPIDRAALAELPPVFSSRALAEHVAWLASPEREGRAPGSAGLAASADYIARAFEAAGLEPGGDDGGWFQDFALAEGPRGAPTRARNVVGILPGSRAEWSDQSIVLGAHFDHLGRGWPDVHAGDEGRIHPGADDNASGVAVLIELARNLAGEGGGSRNLVLVAFSAEEAGRLGSRHYVEHPCFPLSGLRGVINLDTVGRLEGGALQILGTGTADEWQHIFRGCGFVTGIANQIVPGLAESSDQWSFIERGIPGVQIFSGAKDTYHRPSDTAELVDTAGLVQVATFVKEAVVYVLEREEPLTVRIEGTPPVEAQAEAPRSGRRVSFGSVPDYAFQGEGVLISSVTPDSPAARAGVLDGDVLVELDGVEIDGMKAFSDVLKSLEAGQRVVAVLQREGKEVSLEVVVEAR